MEYASKNKKGERKFDCQWVHMDILGPLVHVQILFLDVFEKGFISLNYTLTKQNDGGHYDQEIIRWTAGEKDKNICISLFL